MPTIRVDGKPLGQPRQRHAMIAGHMRNYTPATHPVIAFKHAIKLAWTFGRLEGPLMCSIEAVFERPKSKTKKRGPNSSLPHTSKPDCDNIAKAVCDALNGTAYADDSAVAVLHIRKRIGEPGEHAAVIVNVEVIDQGVTQ